jgi:hypothetical protein
LVSEEISLKYKSTAIYFLAASIAAGLYFFDIRHQEEQSRLEKEAKRLIRTKPSQIETISLEKKSGRILVKKNSASEEEWDLIEPIKSPADKFEIEQIKKTLSELRYTRLITENPKNLSQFGLDNPVLTIKFTSKNESRSISFGTQNPSGDGFYTSTGSDNKVYLVDKSAKEEVDASLYQLRDKKLFRISFEGVKKFSIRQGSEEWILKKKGDEWHFKNDLDFEVDSQKVNSIIRKFLMAEALSFVKEAPNDMESFGLKSPSARVSLSDEKITEEILLGNYIDNNGSKIYAKMSDKPQIIAVDKWLLSDLPKARVLIRKVPEDKKNNDKPEPDTSRKME